LNRDRQVIFPNVKNKRLASLQAVDRGRRLVLVFDRDTAKSGEPLWI
jgi:hypothetical protein